ncbi:MAG: twin-arginine translocase TatA/TatE family subunit [Prolixibacteraceae bacterium]|nr:twin-arginine translocase TatA/TatE family subunit [Prolixibacteraceae bacterium]MBN2650429.1 twin-arginine translocase TatA/TatE family subunit [Prolixibacteraceae bacterium]
MFVLFISGQEILVVLVLVLLFFGAKAIPEIARTLGKGVNEFRKASNDIKREFNQSTSELRKDVDDISKAVNDEIYHLKDDDNKTDKKDD